MARNGSGTMTPAVDFTTEAASPPIEISKLDTFADDIADEITNSIAADGQTNPTAALKMNGFNHTNVGAATALTHYARLTEMIDQDHVYYVDSGSADTYVITPSPAIAAYEEGQRFVVRIANVNTGAATLNVNGLGAIAVQTPDAAALTAGMLAAGGIYEFTYDANTSPDRWVVTSPTSKLPTGMFPATLPAASGVNLTALNGTNIASGTVADARLSTQVVLKDAEISSVDNGSAADPGYRGAPQNNQDGSYTLVLADAGKTIYKAAGGAGETITIPANGSVAFPVGTMVRIVNNGGGDLTIAITTDTLSLAGAGTTGSRTLIDHGVAVIEKVATTEWFISGAGLS